MTSNMLSRLGLTKNLNCIRKLSTIKVVSTDDESTLIAWHPKTDFPYECTKPLPVETQLQGEDTVLKTQFTPELLSILKKKSPDEARQELMNITHTTKHRWFPRSKSRTIQKIEKDREYL